MNLVILARYMQIGKMQQKGGAKKNGFQNSVGSICCFEVMVKYKKLYYIIILQMEKNTPKVYTAILFIPALGFFIPNQTVNQKAYFLVVLALLVVSYFCYWLHFQNNVLNLIRKYLACFCTATLILILSAQVGDILINVYKIDFGEEISFAVKMVFMLSNMQGNLQLCTQKRSHHKVGNSDNNPLNQAI